MGTPYRLLLIMEHMLTGGSGPPNQNPSKAQRMKDDIDLRCGRKEGAMYRNARLALPAIIIPK
jgi:hypothetical protein